jgi:two-component system sensor histidine kinase RpfC
MHGVTSKEVFRIPKPSFICKNLTSEALLEYEQAVIRLVFTTVVTIYFLIHGMVDGKDGYFSTAFFLAFGYDLFSILVLLSFRFKKTKSNVRRMIMMLGDHGMTCLAMYRAGEAGAPLFTVILWITVGYGARYGTKYLHLGMLLSSTGLLALINSTTFWIDHPHIGYGMIVTNIIISVFVLKLLKQLVDAKAAAEKADESKGRFLANMSHEMRTPLSGIIGIASLVSSEKMLPNVRSGLNTIEGSAKHLLNLIDDILNFSKIESGNVSLNCREIDLYDVVYSVTDNLKSVAEDKGLQLHTYINADVPYAVVGDSTRLRQIILNLCGNAIKFTKEGYVDLRLHCLKSKSNEVIIRFEVIDTGIGIPADALKTIFERFNQVDDSITREFGGTGLGTTISKELVELMGGEIHVESTVNKGTRFYFDVPFELSLPDTEDEYNGMRCVLYTKDSSLTNRILNYTKRWQIKCVALNTVFEINKQIIENQTEESCYPFVIIDIESMEGSFEDLLGYLHYGVSKSLNVIAIDEKEKLNLDHHDSDNISVINDISTTRQLYNSIHNTRRKYDLPGNVTDLVTSKKDHFNKIKVLIAEDSQVNRLILEQYLVNHGIDVISADDGDIALEYCEDHTFDAAIVDMQMPRIGGLDMIKEYNAGYGINHKMPFIVLTANVTEDAKRQCEIAGAAAYLQKPIEEKKLLELLFKLTKKEHSEERQEASSHDSSNTVKHHVQKIRSITSNDILDNETITNLLTLTARPGFFEDLVSKFLADTTLLLDKAQTAITQENHEKFHEEVHAIKGSAGNIGATKLFKVASEASRYSLSEFKQNGQTIHLVMSQALNDSRREFFSILESRKQA